MTIKGLSTNSMLTENSSSLSQAENILSYNDPDYQKSRREYVDRIREIVERGLPEPEPDWDTIWVISGPEVQFDDSPETNKVVFALKQDEVNQTKNRFETGLNIAKKVTALRTGKKEENVSLFDIGEYGPLIYFNGKKEQNNYLNNLISEGTFEKIYSFPSNKIIVSSNPEIKHTGHQFEEFPKYLVPTGGKVVVVTDLYHVPRVERYFNKYPIIPEGNRIIYPASPTILPVTRALSEAKKIYRYIQQGIL